jgi:hypothetical protein
MIVIHFTRGAADPLTAFGATDARFLPLAEALDSNAIIVSPSVTHATALLIVYGRITVTTQPLKVGSTSKLYGLRHRKRGTLQPEFGTGSHPAHRWVLTPYRPRTRHPHPDRIGGATWPVDLTAAAESH